MPLIILYGPPAAGKDTVTAALTASDSKYQQYLRLKVGGGRRQGYRATSLAELNALRCAGEIVWENERYGAIYAIDRTSLLAQLREGVPIVHLGQLEAVAAVAGAVTDVVLTVALRCPRNIAAARLVARGTHDVPTRLEVWDSTKPFPAANLVLDTSAVSPMQAARLIDKELRRQSPR